MAAFKEQLSAGLIPTWNREMISKDTQVQVCTSEGPRALVPTELYCVLKIKAKRERTLEMKARRLNAEEADNRIAGNQHWKDLGPSPWRPRGQPLQEGQRRRGGLDVTTRDELRQAAAPPPKTEEDAAF